MDEARLFEREAVERQPRATARSLREGHGDACDIASADSLLHIARA